MTHLDPQRYRALLANPGQLTPELRAHLRTGCETCAEAAMGAGVDPLDGPADALLLGAARESAAPTGEVEKVLARVGPSRSWTVPVAVAAGAVMALFGATLALRSPTTQPYQGEKGVASLSVAASFAAVGPDGGVQRGVRGASYPQSTALAVRVELERPLNISLVREGSGNLEVLLLNAAVPAGSHDLQKDGATLGISLRGQVGLQHVAVLASERALSSKEVEAAARGEAVDGVARSGFDVVVSP